jgi:hypothetical protein
MHCGGNFFSTASADVTERRPLPRKNERQRAAHAKLIQQREIDTFAPKSALDLLLRCTIGTPDAFRRRRLPRFAARCSEPITPERYADQGESAERHDGRTGIAPCGRGSHEPPANLAARWRKREP